MANKVLIMLQVRRILQLLEQDYSKREAAHQLDVSCNTIDFYARRLNLSVLTLSQLLGLNDDLAKFMYPVQAASVKEDTRANHFDTKVEHFLKELTRTGVTRLRL